VSSQSYSAVLSSRLTDHTTASTKRIIRVFCVMMSVMYWWGGSEGGAACSVRYMAGDSDGTFRQNDASRERSGRVDDLSTLIRREFIRRYGLHNDPAYQISSRTGTNALCQVVVVLTPMQRRQCAMRLQLPAAEKTTICRRLFGGGEL